MRRTELINEVVAAENNVRVRDLAGNVRFRSWLEGKGLTLEEAAWIQPTYGGERNNLAEDEHLILTVYGGIASGGLALYSHLTEPGAREFQVAGALNVSLRAEARDGESRGESVVRGRLQVSLPEPSWIHGRLGVQFRAVH